MVFLQKETRRRFWRGLCFPIRPFLPPNFRRRIILRNILPTSFTSVVHPKVVRQKQLRLFCQSRMFGGLLLPVSIFESFIQSAPAFRTIQGFFFFEGSSSFQFFSCSILWESYYYWKEIDWTPDSSDISTDDWNLLENFCITFVSVVESEAIRQHLTADIVDTPCRCSSASFFENHHFRCSAESFLNR